MKPLACVTPAIVAALLSLAHAVSAAGSGPLPLPAPPPPRAPGAQTILQAMLAIQRAQATNPAAAQNATFSYKAAIQQYNAREFQQARASALTAISQSAVPAPLPAAAPAARMATPAFPGPNYFVLPDELPATEANAQTYVELAHRAMARCDNPKAAAVDYRGAQSALNAKQYRTAMAASRNIIDDCTAR